MAEGLNDDNLNPGTGPARGLLLNADNDVAFSVGSMVLVRGTQAILQDVAVRCRFFRGESVVDITVGVDPEEVFTKPPQPLAAAAAFRREILATPGVASVQDVRVEFIPAERRLTLDYRATSTDGAEFADTLTVGA